MPRRRFTTLASLMLAAIAIACGSNGDDPGVSTDDAGSTPGVETERPGMEDGDAGPSTAEGGATTDASAGDASVGDAGVTDAGSNDASANDAGASDGGGFDAGTVVGAATCGDMAGLQVGAPWPMKGRCPTRIGRADVVGTAQGKRKWQYDLGGFPIYRTAVVSAPSVDKDGTIYFGVQPVATLSGGLYALKPDGALSWFFSTGNKSVRSGAVVRADGSLIVIAGDKLHALEKTGVVRWTYDLGYVAISAPLVTGDGTIYVGTQNARLHAIAPSGTKKWIHDFSAYCNAIPGGAALGVDGRIWVGCAGMSFWIKPDGVTYGGYPLQNAGLTHAPPTIGAGGVAWQGATDGTLYAFSSTGTLLKRHEFYWQGTIQFENGPSIAPDGSVYFSVPTTASGQSAVSLCAIRGAPTSTAVCSLSKGGGIMAQTAVDAASNVYFVAGKKLVSETASGALRWQFGLDEGVQHGMAFGADGTIYLGTVNGTFYAVGDPP